MPSLLLGPDPFFGLNSRFMGRFVVADNPEVSRASMADKTNKADEGAKDAEDADADTVHPENGEPAASNGGTTSRGRSLNGDCTTNDADEHKSEDGAPSQGA